ncbi:MAG: T9SS C-terminal target domain-containing protein [Calditrichaeota bacterium]|nr:MAG: T9SS C-terminal target domain-containing protein [Calditrichota bacterium]
MRKVIIFVLSFFTLAGFSRAFSQNVPRTLYVLNGLGRTLSKMDLDTSQITNDVVVVGDIPNRVYAWRDQIYVVNSTPPGITIIDPRTDEVVKSIALAEGSNPWDMAFVGTHKAYVTNLLANTVSVVDLENGNILNTIPVGEGPEGILVVNNTAYVVNTGGFPDYNPSTISVIDILSDRVTKTLEVPLNPQDLDLAPDGKIHVVCTGNFSDVRGQTVVIDPFGDVDFTPLVVDTVKIGGSPGDIVVTSDGLVYLADFGDANNGFLYSYNASTREVLHDATNPILVGKGAMNLLFDTRTGNLFVNNFSDDAVQLLDASNGAVVNTFEFGDGAQHMAILEPIQDSDPWADAVVSFTPGEGAGFGQNFFPDNVLGPPDPDPTLSPVNPSSKPQELLSLGKGGEIILEFTDNFIVDKEGVDFTVFENAFYINGDTTQPFIEAAFVAVSMDGQTWFEFPWDTTTWSGFAGVTPTKDNQHPTDPQVSGGDSFDLADVGLPWAKFVKLTDIGDLKQEGAFNGDFDLDAVVAVHSQPGQPTSVEQTPEAQPRTFTLFQNYPNPFNPSTTIEFEIARNSRVQIKIFNLQGQEIRTLVNRSFPAGKFRIKWDGKDAHGQNVASGIYFYQMQVNNFHQVRRMTLLR